MYSVLNTYGGEGRGGTKEEEQKRERRKRKRRTDWLNDLNLCGVIKERSYDTAKQKRIKKSDELSDAKEITMID